MLNVTLPYRYFQVDVEDRMCETSTEVLNEVDYGIESRVDYKKFFLINRIASIKHPDYCEQDIENKLMKLL